MSLDQIMEQLQAEYLESLPEKINFLKIELSKKNYEGIREQFHKLKGTGSTYGLPEISLLGETAEKALLASQNDYEWVTSDAIDLLDQIYEARKSAKEAPVESNEKFQKIRSLLSA